MFNLRVVASNIEHKFSVDHPEIEQCLIFEVQTATSGSVHTPTHLPRTKVA
jgi:hypothetical protein